MKTLHIVEAALFSAGRPLAIEEIREETGLAGNTIKKAIKELQALYAERDTVLEVGKAGTKWGMQVRTQAAEPAAKFAQMEIPAKVLKTLALIAYHQPVKQSEICDMIGSRVYDHVPELKERGLIRTRREGQTKIITTTDAFPEYFGLDAATPDQIRGVMAKLVGLPPPEKRREEKPVASFQAPTEAEAPERSSSEPRNDDPGPAVTQPTPDEEPAQAADEPGETPLEAPLTTTES